MDALAAILQELRGLSALTEERLMTLEQETRALRDSIEASQESQKT
jgi:hypothetical protein